MAKDTKKIGLMGLDPALLRTGETVSRLAIELAKLEASDNQSPDVDGAVPDAWRLLRRACLEIETDGRNRTIEDYKRFRIRPPQEFLEALKPPPPPPHRELFHTLFNKDQSTIFLPSKLVEGLNETFEWRQLTPWDAESEPPSAELKTRPYKIAREVIDSRVRQGIDKINDNGFLSNLLCNGFDWKWDWADLPLDLAKKSDQITGLFDPQVNREEWEALAKCANEFPRPHNCSVERFFSFSVFDDPLQMWKLRMLPDSESLPGPTPPDGTTVEVLYEQAMTWAEAVIEAWKKEIVRLEFDAFWTEGKEHGFLWKDVKAMALYTKKHKGGIKWHAGKSPTMEGGPNGGNVAIREHIMGRMWNPRDFYRKDVGW